MIKFKKAYVILSLIFALSVIGYGLFNSAITVQATEYGTEYGADNSGYGATENAPPDRSARAYFHRSHPRLLFLSLRIS